MEHLNDLPWRNKFRVLYAEVDEAGLRLDDLEKKLKISGRVRLVTVTVPQCLDVNPIGEIAHLAHQPVPNLGRRSPNGYLPVSAKGFADGEFIDYLVFRARCMPPSVPVF